MQHSLGETWAFNKHATQLSVEAAYQAMFELQYLWGVVEENRAPQHHVIVAPQLKAQVEARHMSLHVMDIFHELSSTETIPLRVHSICDQLLHAINGPLPETEREILIQRAHLSRCLSSTQNSVSSALPAENVTWKPTTREKLQSAFAFQWQQRHAPHQYESLVEIVRNAENETQTIDVLPLLFVEAATVTDGLPCLILQVTPPLVTTDAIHD